MKISNNIAALQGLNSVHRNNKMVSDSIQRLSSGLRINKVADDVSGYAMANKIRTQVQGTKQANNNAMDGISIIQTAEGALHEVHEMLHRMRELAVQAANGTNGLEDRQQIQAEMDHLIAEINTTTGNTEFNTMKLLDGEEPIEEAPFIVELKRTVDEDGNVIADLTGNPRLARVDEYAQYTVKILDSATADPGTGFTLDGVVFEYYDSAEGPYKGTAQPIDISKDKPSGSTSDVLHRYNASPGFKNFVFNEKGGEFRLTAKEKGNAGNYMIAHKGGTPPSDMKSQVGANANEVLDMNLAAISSTTLGLLAPKGTPGYNSISKIESANVNEVSAQANAVLSKSRFENDASSEGIVSDANPINNENMDNDKTRNATAQYMGLSVLNEDDIQYAINAIDKAINSVSRVRSTMGAYQHRLEYTVENLNSVEENMTTSLSEIKDTDMAIEMTEYTRTNLLTQSAIAMLGKANELPGLVMQLMQN